MFDVGARFEWLEIPREPARVVDLAAVDAAGSYARCPRCAWLAPRADAACENCGLEATAGVAESAAVELPPAEIAMADGAELLAGPEATPEALGLLVQIEAARLAHGFDRLITLDARAVEHQLHHARVALRVLRELHGRAVLADEPGLGKATQAGIVLAELAARGLATRVLVLAPPERAAHWHHALAARFGLQTQLARRADDLPRHDRVVASLALAQRPQAAAAIRERPWDALVVDGAHALGDTASSAHALVRDTTARYLLLLTATPIRRTLLELHALVDLVDPGRLGTPRQFRQRHVDRDDPRVARDVPALRRALAGIVVRTRRSDVGLRVPPRRAAVVHVPPAPAEHALYAAVVALARDAAQRAAPARRRALGALVRATCSSVAAVEAALAPLAADRALRPAVFAAIDLAQAARAAERKPRALLEALERLPEKAVVFTDCAASVDAIVAALTARDVATAQCLDGQDPRERRAALARFRADARVLVCSSATPWPDDVPPCADVVHYEAPWNPVRREQQLRRAGRVSARGASRREVTTVTLCHQVGIEAALWPLWVDRLQILALSPGDLDLALEALGGGVGLAARIEAALLDGADDGATTAALAALGATLADAVAALATLRTGVATLDALAAPTRGARG